MEFLTKRKGQVSFARLMEVLAELAKGREVAQRDRFETMKSNNDIFEVKELRGRARLLGFFDAQPARDLVICDHHYLKHGNSPAEERPHQDRAILRADHFRGLWLKARRPPVSLCAGCDDCRIV
jgi:hypothetical protein